MDIISRIKQYMEYCNMSSSQFADAAGIPRPTLSQLLNGRNKTNEGAKKISSDIVRKLHDAFPSLNIMWLLFGDGDMETNENIKISEPQNKPIQINKSEEATEGQDIQRQILFDEDLPDFESENNFNQKSEFSIPPAEGQSTNFRIEAVANGNSSKKSVPAMAFQPDNTKRVQSIMVFYSDNSFEIFKPAE